MNENKTASGGLVVYCTAGGRIYMIQVRSVCKNVSQICGYRILAVPFTAEDKYSMYMYVQYIL
jgi:hypothetical protein